MAKITEKLSKLFGFNNSDENQYYDDEPEIQDSVAVEKVEKLPETNLAPLVVPSQESSQPQQEILVLNKTDEMPYWMQDEDILRDEGALFGLSESDPTEKTEIIRQYFTQQAAEHIADIEQHNEQIQELNLFIGQKDNRIQELKSKLAPYEAKRYTTDHQLPRTLIGLTLCVAMCVGNYYLIKESLEPVFKENSPIAIGVFLAGMFSLFGRFSIFHDGDSKVTWRSLLEEIGLPFAASLFVFTQALTHQTVWQALALFVFVFFLFLFAGKLLLSNITLLRNDLQSWLGMEKERRQSDKSCNNWEQEALILQEAIDDLRIKKWQLLRDQGNAETQRDKIFAKRDMLVKLFESEFYLARKMKPNLSTRQIKDITTGTRD